MWHDSFRVNRCGVHPCRQTSRVPADPFPQQTAQEAIEGKGLSHSADGELLAAASSNHRKCACCVTLHGFVAAAATSALTFHC